MQLFQEHFNDEIKIAGNRYIYNNNKSNMVREAIKIVFKIFEMFQNPN